mgnify:CR=1 FL=1
MNKKKYSVVSAIKHILAQIGLGIYRERRKKIVWQNSPSKKTHQRIFTNATYSPWIDNKNFQKIYSIVKDHTLLDKFRLYELFELVKQTNDVEGDILEIGVYKGGSGILLAKASVNLKKTVYLLDTFEGVVKAGGKDTKYQGGEHFDTSVEQIQRLIKKYKIKNTKIFKGVFPDDFTDSVDKVSFVHCDVDVYKSCRDIIEYLLPKLSVGSIIVFDDYGFDGCEGVTSYCEELRENNNFHFVYNLNGHGIFIKYKCD